MKKKLYLVIAILFFVSTAYGVYLSSTPSNINLGEVEPGSTHQVDFYVDTDAQQPFELRPQVENAAISKMLEDIPSDNISEQDVTSWVDFTEESFTIDPQTSQEYTMVNGETTRANGFYTLSVNVPPRGKAEPGYHMVNLRPNPQFSGESGSGFGTTSIGLAIPSLVFRVDGDVERSIQVTDAEALRVGQNQVQVVLQFTNTGTVTTSYQGDTLNVYQEDRKVNELYFAGFDIPPGESIETEAIWTSSNLDGGVYRIEGPLDHWTGQFYVEEDISFTNTPQPRREVDEPEPDDEQGEDNFPMWLFILALTALGSVMYSFEFNLFSILLAIGTIGFATIILITSASNYLLLLLLTSLAVMINYGGI